MNRFDLPTAMRIAVALGALGVSGVSEGQAHPGCGLVVDAGGRIYFVPPFSHRVMRIDADGTVSVFASDVRFRLLHHLSIDRDGMLYTVSDHDSRVWRIAPDGVVSLFLDSRRVAGVSVGAGGDPFTVAPTGDALIFADRTGANGAGRSRVGRIDTAGTVTFLAGDQPGHVDGPGRVARFGNLHFSEIELGPAGVVYVTDGSHVRTIDPSGMVATFATVRPEGTRLVGLAAIHPDTVVVADYGGRRVIRVSRGGGVETILDGNVGQPTGVARGPDGTIVVMTYSPAGTFVYAVDTGGAVQQLAVVRDKSAPITLMLGVLLVLPALSVAWLWQAAPVGPAKTATRILLVGAIALLGWAQVGATPYAGGFVPWLAWWGRHVVVAAFVVVSLTVLRRAKATSVE